MIGQLTNHLWQSTLFALAAALLTLAFRENRAKVRYSLWLAASLKFLIPFSVLMGIGSQLQWMPAAQRMAAHAPSQDALAAIGQFSEPFRFDTPAAPRLPAPSTDWKPRVLATIWLGGLLFIVYWRWRAWRGVRAETKRSVPLDVSLPIEARLSGGIREPGVVGFFRPILLLPEGILERLSASELEAVIAHELCHARRRDNLVAAIHMVVEALFWFHPLVWWIGARLIEERERACDEHVLSLGSQPDVYADAILNVCKLYTESPLECVSGVTGADLRRRIEAIMANNGAAGLNAAKKFLLAGVAVAAVAAPVATGVLTGIGHVRAAFAQTAPPRPLPQPVALASPQRQQPEPAAKPPAPPQAAKPAPKFDAASIRECVTGEVAPGRGGSGVVGPPPANGLSGYFSVTPGRFNVSCGTLLTMIDFAYVEFGQERLVNDTADPMHSGGRLKGLPGWAMSARYTIEATTDDPIANGPTQGRASEAQRLMYGPMFQALLEDRFQLKFHRDTEDIPMYALTVAKGGLKIKPSTEAECTELEHLANGGTIMRRLKEGDKPYCQWMGGDPHGPNRTVVGGGVPLSRLADFLSNFVMDRHVIDKTGITEKFNIHVEFLPDERTPCTLGAMCKVDAESTIPAAPSIFTALEQQLGLKLESTKGPHGYLVVDHVARPSEN